MSRFIKFITLLITNLLISLPVYADALPIGDYEDNTLDYLKWIGIGVGIVMIISMLCLKLYFPKNLEKEAEKENKE